MEGATVGNVDGITDGDAETIGVVVMAGLAVGVLPPPRKQWEYHLLITTHPVLVAHVVHPMKPSPPHWSHSFTEHDAVTAAGDSSLLLRFV